MMFMLVSGQAVMAQALQTVHASIGVGSKLVWGGGGYDIAVPLFNRRLAVGLGVRTTLANSGSRVYHTAETKFAATDQDQLLAQNLAIGNGALYFTIEGRVYRRFGIGFNIDLVGYSFGRNYPANYGADGAGPPVSVNGNQYSLLLTTKNDHGFLHAEVYVSYKVGNRVQLRAGLAHQNLELQLSQEPINPGHDRFRQYISSGFVGVAIGLAGYDK